jgi:glycosyltransferase involved in cell wall biosynthesis
VLVADVSRRARLALLLQTLEGVLATPHEGSSALLVRAGEAIERTGDSGLWLALAILEARLPLREQVVELRRDVLRQGGARALAAVYRGAPRRSRPVHVVDGVVVDVHHTARTDLATGIQRVVRKTIAEWRLRHSLQLVGWDDAYQSMRELSAAQVRNALEGGSSGSGPGGAGEIVIPWNACYLLPELAIESARTQRIQALAEFSGNATGVIGYDCVPLTSAETTGGGMPGAFAKNLRAVAEMSRVATISEAAAVEYRGWREMLRSIGLLGPDIRAIRLAAEGEVVDEGDIARARAEFSPDGKAVLLCVGSHEPRKNHLAVLASAEELWRRGLDFRLVFVGGNGWRGEEFGTQLRRLQRAGRPVVAMQRASDALLWAAYRIADATVFPSFNEGFGLPVVESMLSGTPVVTSDFGSMREIATAGALLVDPRDDRALTDALERVLSDTELRDELRRELVGYRGKRWADYAAELWEYLVVP